LSLVLVHENPQVPFNQKLPCHTALTC